MCSRMPLDLGNFTSPTLSGSKRKAQAGAVRSNQVFFVIATMAEKMIHTQEPQHLSAI
jgi:hypothetical protein